MKKIVLFLGLCVFGSTIYAGGFQGSFVVEDPESTTPTVESTSSTVRRALTRSSAR